VLQCVAVRCSVLQHGAVCCEKGHWQRRRSPVAVCCSALQCVALCCSALKCVVRRVIGNVGDHLLICVAVRCIVLECVAVRCNVLKCFEVC